MSMVFAYGVQSDRLGTYSEFQKFLLNMESIKQTKNDSSAISRLSTSPKIQQEKSENLEFLEYVINITETYDTKTLRSQRKNSLL